MKRSTDRIRTTHTGSMPRPPELLEALRKQAAGEPMEAAAFEALLERQVSETVKMQVERGIDVVNDGECSKASFASYVGERLAGLESRKPAAGPQLGPVNLEGRDAKRFPEYYQGLLGNNPFADVIRVAPRVCVGPIEYVGHAKVARDIANLKKAMAAHGADEGFMPAFSPLPQFENEYYKTADEFVAACGEAMREEYRAILDAGLLLQIDDPRMVSSWDSRDNMSLADYRKWMERRVESINHALRGLPQERIRYHTCYGVNFGPRVSDLQLADVIDVLYKINAGSISFEASNPRHEHEWKVPLTMRPPEGRILIPGCVTHSNVMIEHPEAVADRIELWAQTTGRENLIVGNDCGFQSTAGNREIPRSIAWAKLASLGEGARIATARIYR